MTAAAMTSAAAVAGGCSKSPTTILAIVTVDDTVPPIRVLRSQVMQTSGAGQVAGAERRSPLPPMGDASDRSDPFSFPLALPLTVDRSFAGAVQVTIEGVDWDTNAVTATGTAPADVIAEQQTDVTVMLSAPPPTGAGGAAGAGGAGGAAP